MQFRWRFLPKEQDSTLAVYGSISGRQPLVVTLRGGQESWVIFSTASISEPAMIGPKFVRQAIEYGLIQGWQLNKPGAILHVDYENSNFSVHPNQLN
ncbi:hypothetical protein H6F89_08285 [Cyanobacteria bacterium FACHB-63]|nr:hypothetical protein [Cyanobacteria bacterium FACHB-63]